MRYYLSYKLSVHIVHTLLINDINDPVFTEIKFSNSNRSSCIPTREKFEREPRDLLCFRTYVRKYNYINAVMNIRLNIINGSHFKCAIRNKLTLSASSDNVRWLVRAGNKYFRTEVSDTEAAVEVLHTYIAYPLFCALFEQQVSL